MSTGEFIPSVMDAVDRHEQREERKAIQESEPESGRNRTAYFTPMEAVKPSEEGDVDYPLPPHQMSDLPFLPPVRIVERDYSDIGLWQDTKVPKVHRSDNTHSRALELFGLDHVLEETVELLDTCLEHGMVYVDSKTDNIHFYGEKARPVDLEDGSWNIHHPLEAESEEFRDAATASYRNYVETLSEEVHASDRRVMAKVLDSSRHLEDIFPSVPPATDHYLKQAYSPDLDSFEDQHVEERYL